MAQCRGKVPPKKPAAIAKAKTIKKRPIANGDHYRFELSTDGDDGKYSDGTVVGYELKESSLTIELNRKSGTLTTTRHNLHTKLNGDTFTLNQRDESKVEKTNVSKYQPMVFKTTNGGAIQLTIRKK